MAETRCRLPRKRQPEPRCLLGPNSCWIAGCKHFKSSIHPDPLPFAMCRAAEGKKRGFDSPPWCETTAQLQPRLPLVTLCLCPARLRSRSQGGAFLGRSLPSLMSHLWPLKPARASSQPPRRLSHLLPPLPVPEGLWFQLSPALGSRGSGHRHRDALGEPTRCGRMAPTAP